MITLNVQGASEEPANNIESTTDLLKITPKKSFRLDISRAAVEPIAISVENEDVMKIELDGGMVLWTRVDQYRLDFPQATSRDATGDILQIPVELPIGGPSRGLSSWIIKGLQIFGIETPSATSAKQLAKLLENGLEVDPGLYRCDSGIELNLLPTKPDDIPQDKPILIFIHGIASSTRGSFNELWDKHQTIRQDIYKQYNNEVYALEHRTLTESPIDNVLDLVKALPDKAIIHLVTHSRGGLVGELLCRATVVEGHDPFSNEVCNRYAEAGEEYADQAKGLRTLNALMQAKNITIQRFVRVACPVRGTTLASGRLDRWLSILVNLVGQIPTLKGNPLYKGLTEFTLAVVKERTNPKTIPGLEAQMPDSPLIRLLNLSGITVQADLSIISGDVEADSYWGKLKYLIPDLFYGHNHDLMVDTQSMFGGATRMPNNARYFFDQGSNVNHFRYFENEITANQLWLGLSRADDSEGGFHPWPEKASKRIVREVRISATPQPIVFILPGIMGSNLSVDGNRIWVDPWDLAFGGIAKLKIEAPDVTAESPLELYQGLIEYLSDTHEVIPFAYDWRKSLIDEADRFAINVEKNLLRAEQNNQAVSFLAHSLGGLLVRILIAKYPDLWQRICQLDNSRLIMLGTPNCGSYTIPRILMGQEKIVHSLALVDLKHSLPELLEIISQFPGVLQLLPTHHDFFKFDKEDDWKALKKKFGGDWHIPLEKDLEKVREFQKLLRESPIDPQRMLYIAGHAHTTPIDMQVDVNSKQIQFIASSQGDGRVPWSNGTPEGVKTWYMEAEHGNMADYEPGFSAIKELLVHGSTDKFKTTPPIDRSVQDRFPLPADHADMLPDKNMLYQEMLGYQHKIHFTVSTEPVKIIVSHGNLGYARNTIAIGHYSGDSILSAEAHVDKLYQGRLQKLIDFDIYPGPLNTSTFIQNPVAESNHTPAAIIIGLGDVGSLTPAKLTATFRHALLKYATQEINNPCKKISASEALHLRISSLLIGTSFGGIGIEDSISAILQSIREVNEQLNNSNCKGVRFEEIEFVELWEDLAIQAAHAVKRIANDNTLKKNDHGCDFTYKKALQLDTINNSAYGAKLQTIKGGRKRIFAEEATGWWRRIQITADVNGGLLFNTLTDRARSEISLHDAQRTMVDEFITQAISSGYDDPELSKTLFELLLPYRLKEQAPDIRDLVLVLDEQAAYYPWELIQDRWGDNNNPMVVTHGVLRQLHASISRETPKSTQQNTALVIGNPKSDFVDLPGAQKEAEHVWEFLSQKGFDSVKVLGENADLDAQRVISKLHENSYRVLHLAGHGVYRYPLNNSAETCEYCDQEVTTSQNEVTGMVIGKDAFLTPGDIENMRFVPELVFINCCHLGHIDAKGRKSDKSLKYKLAANLATEFIRMGVKVVVAAGWAVNDLAATTFASKFYQEMLAGVAFGKAVLKARQETYNKHKGCNTWGAYQCYGDPDYRLMRKKEQNSTVSDINEMVSPAEVISVLDDIAIAAEHASQVDLQALQAKTKQLVNKLPEEWKKTSEIASALGKTHSELGNFNQAIDCYRNAINTEKGNFCASTIEQLANLKGRTAITFWRERNQNEAIVQLDEAEKLLKKLLNISATGERLSMMASICKRRAWVDSSNRKKMLEKTSEFYHQAYGKNKSNYPRINWLTAEMILSWYNLGKTLTENNNKQLKQLQKQIDEVAKDLVNSPKVITDFWTATGQVDFKLLKYLFENKIEEYIDNIVMEYQQAKQKGATVREFDSVLAHIEFLIAMTAIIKPTKQREPLLQGLQSIFDRLNV